MKTATPVIPATAPCPKCGADAKWEMPRYVCRQPDCRVNRRAFRFAGPSGICEGETRGDGYYGGNYCDKRATVIEPATRDEYRAGGEIVQVPNTEWNGANLAGRGYCGTHSPSLKSARYAAKRKAEHDEQVRRTRAFESAKATRQQTIDGYAAILTAACTTAEQHEALGKLLAMIPGR